MTMPLDQRLNPSTSALIIVDMQNDFVHSDGETSRWMGERLRIAGKPAPPGTPLVQRIVPTLEALIADARRVGVLVVWVRMELTAETRNRFMQSEGWYPCERGTWGAEWYGELCPSSEDIVVVKRRHSAFFGTDLADVLRRHGVETVLVTGTATQGCVEGTIRDACAHDFWAVVIGDCCGQMNEVEHEIALERMDRVFGERIDSENLRVSWFRSDARDGDSVSG